MQFELDENQFITLSLVLGYNKSDASYGWNGMEHGAELYFSHITDEIMDTAQSIPLTAGLQPVISLQNIQKTYLGSPYTACIGSFHKIVYHHDRMSPRSFIASETLQASDVSNKYTYDYGPDKYRQNSCVFKSLLKGIQDYCNCIPRYIDDIEDHIQEKFCKYSLIHRTRNFLRKSMRNFHKSPNQWICPTAAIIYMVFAFRIFSIVSSLIIPIACQPVIHLLFASLVQR